MWKWAAWLEGTLPSHKRMVRQLLEETSVALVPASGKGDLDTETVWLAQLPRGLARSATRGELRRNFTHVALQSEVESVQRILPPA